MYRIFCESYINFCNSFNEDNYRLKVAKPFELIVDLEKFQNEKDMKSDIYKSLCDLICFMSENVNRFPRIKSFLWMLSSRNIRPEKKYNIAKVEELEEQTKLVNSFLKLAYWY